MSKRTLLTVSCLLVVSVVAFVAGRWASEIVRPRLDAAAMEVEVDRLLAVPSMHDRMLGLAGLVDRLDESNAEGMGLALARNVSSTDNNDLRLLLSAWSALDARAAFDSVMTWPLESKRAVGAGVVAYEWGRQGRSIEVRDYIQAIDQPTVRDSAIRGLVQGWAQSGDLQGLTALVMQEKLVGTRDHLTEILVNSLLARGGVEAVMKWADSVPEDADGRYKRTAYRKALRQVSNRDPEAAARWSAAQGDAPHARRSIPVIAGEWAEHDPSAALAWLLSQPDGREREVGLQRWISRFASKDYRAAIEWMNGADLTGPLAGMPIRFVGALLPDHPAEASVWVERVEDETLRARAAREVALHWRVRDPVAAEKWMVEQGLDPARFGRVSGGRDGQGVVQESVMSAKREESSP